MKTLPPKLILSQFLYQQANIPADDVQSLFQCIGAHDSLTAFMTISENLLQILPWLCIIDQELWKKEKINKWLVVCRAILVHQEYLGEKISDFRASNSGNRNGPMFGFIHECPLYSSLWATPAPGGVSDEILTYLQAIFIHASVCFQLYQKEKRDKKYDAIVSQYSLLIRKLGYNRKIAALLIDFSAPLNNINTFHDAIETSIEQSIDKDDSGTQLLLIIERLAAYSLGLRGGYTRSKNKKKLCPAKVTKATPDEPSDGLAIPLVPTIDICHSTVDESEAKEAFMQGCSPDEAYGGPTFFAENTFLEDEKISLVAKVMQTRNRHRHIANSNQLLPTKWPRFNYHDAFHLFKALDRLIKGEIPGMVLDQEKREVLAALIGIMYFTSSDFSRAIETHVCQRVKQLPQSISQNAVYICLADRIIALAAPDLQQRRKAKAAWKYLLEPVAQHILLPASNLFLLLTEGAIKRGLEKMKKRCVRLFADGCQDSMKSELHSFIDRINQESRTRLTAHRIASHLMQLTADHCQDPADAALIYGECPTGATKTSLYYYAPKVEHLQSKY